MPEEGQIRASAAGTFLGMTVSEINRELRAYLRLRRGDTGVVITEVQRSSPADNAGLSPGYVIQKINKTEITTLADYNRFVRSHASEESYLILLKRGRTTWYTTIKR